MKSDHPVRFLACVVVVAACAPIGLTDPEGTPARDEVPRGKELYQQFCASCHGVDLAGDPDWKTPNDDGSFPPPPHDTSGHTWHHSDQTLIQIIRDGSDSPQSRMPQFGDQLTDDDMISILEYLKGHWGEKEREYQRQLNEQETP